jgi:hypothetical protein
METMKQCVKCREVKDESNFSKCSARKDGLQWNCKECNKEDNQKFRTQINPNHHAEWQRNNPQRLSELVNRYVRADKPGIIYSIKNPNGDVYIGQSKKYMTVRKTSHTTHYNRANKGKMNRLPLLFDSFDKYGIKNHKFEVVVELGDMDRKQLKYVEASFIRAFKEIGKSLNIRDN